MLAILLFLLNLPPRTSVDIVCALVGESCPRSEMLSICERESNCQPVSIHKGDSKWAKAMYQNAVRVGWLSPSTCLWHQANPVEFGVRGAFGTSAAYTLHHIGRCLPPALIDIPLVAAWATYRRMEYQCRRYRACTKDARRTLWAGRKTLHGKKP
jgi:hypothetical protein